jgi:predicted nucleic acid-binding protein
LGLSVTGPIGLIVSAKIKEVIPSVIPFLDALKKDGFWISPEIEKTALDATGETYF